MFKKKDYGFITDIQCSKNGIHFKSYKVWKSMIERCYNKNNHAYKHYGEKGVTICNEWNLYSNFKKWFDKNYIEGFQIDKDFAGGKLYSPETCIFISAKENAREARSRQDYSYLSKKQSGTGNINSKPLEYYKKNPVFRFDFKTTCKKQGWNFEDFEEIFSGQKRTGNGKSDKKYFYIYKKELTGVE